MHISEIYKQCIEAVRASSDLPMVHLSLISMNVPARKPATGSFSLADSEDDTADVIGMVLDFVHRCARENIELVFPLDNDTAVLNKYCTHFGEANAELDMVCVFPAMRRDGRVVPGLSACIKRHDDCWSYLNVNTNPSWVNRRLVFDVEAYMGRWYEIAFVQSWFEWIPDGEVTALYDLPNGPGGQITVSNSVKLASGLPSYVNKGKAELVENRVGVLDVEISPLPVPEVLRELGSALNPFPKQKGNYWIIRLGAKDIEGFYSYSVVYSKSSGLVWILNRQPTMGRQQYNELRAFIRSRGIDATIFERKGAVQ